MSYIELVFDIVYLLGRLDESESDGTSIWTSGATYWKKLSKIVLMREFLRSSQRVQQSFFSVFALWLEWCCLSSPSLDDCLLFLLEAVVPTCWEFNIPLLLPMCLDLYKNSSNWSIITGGGWAACSKLKWECSCCLLNCPLLLTCQGEIGENSELFEKTSDCSSEGS